MKVKTNKITMETYFWTNDIIWPAIKNIWDLIIQFKKIIIGLIYDNMGCWNYLVNVVDQKNVLKFG